MSSFESPIGKKRSSTDPSSLSARRSRSDGASAAGRVRSPPSVDLLRTMSSSIGGSARSGPISDLSVVSKKSGRYQTHPKQHICGDENDKDVDEGKGDLDEEVDMGDWTLIGPPGTYAEGVFQGCLRSNRLEVAVKVVSLRNHHIHDSVSVQEKLRQKRKDGIKITEDVMLKVYEEKVLQEMYMQGTLSNKHICFFAGYHKESSSYRSKVLDNPNHDLHRAFRGSEGEDEGPRRDKLLFFVMEKLSGEDLHEYNAYDLFGCGFLLAFEAAAGASNDQVKDALGRFPPFRAAFDALAQDLKEKESPTDFYKHYLYLDAEQRFLYDHKGGQFLVLKFNTKFKGIDRSQYRRSQPQTFCEEVRTHLVGLGLICNCESMTKKSDNGHFMYRPLPLFFDQTFIRTVLTHVMIALHHAHGTPMYHDDLKPDNIMLKYPVHAHSTHETKICAKVIDWGCCGFSKDVKSDSRHQYKPKTESHTEKCDVFCVGNTLRFLYDARWFESVHYDNAETGEHLERPKEFSERDGWFLRKLNDPIWHCPWNKSKDFQRIESATCVPWNPNLDKDFIHLVHHMIHPDVKFRYNVNDVLRHRWVTHRPKHATVKEADLPQDDMSHVKKLNDILYSFAPPYLKKLHDSHDDNQNEETKFIDLMKSADLPVLTRSLDVLVMLPMLEQAPHARGFISSNLVAILSKFVVDYMYNESYSQRHLPRTMKLLAQLASHQNTEFLQKIFSAKHLDSERKGHDSDGRTLLELITYGVFDCHDPDPNHRACSLYTMLMLLALSSPSRDDHHIVDPSSYHTVDVIKFLRDKKDKRPKPLKSVFNALVELLEQLTHSPDDAERRRHELLSQLLSLKTSPLKCLFDVLSKANKSPSDAATMLREDGAHFALVRDSLIDFQHSVRPVHRDPNCSRFIDKFLMLPDPGSQMLKLHERLGYCDVTDEVAPMFKTNNGSITSSTHGILSRLVQALFNVSTMPSSAVSAHTTGLDILLDDGDGDCFMLRIMRCMQTVHKVYPKAFIKQKPVLTKTSLLDYVVRIWKKLDDVPAKASIASCLDQSFLDMLEKPLAPSLELLVLGSP